MTKSWLAYKNASLPRHQPQGTQKADEGHTQFFGISTTTGPGLPDEAK